MKRSLCGWGSSAALALLLFLAGCAGGDTDDGIAVVDGGNAANASAGDDGDDGGDTGASADGGSDDADTSGDDAAEGDDAGGSGGDDTTSSTEAVDPEEDDDLPGEPYDFVPGAGTPLDVVGVRHDDVLNFRTRPDPSAPIVATIAPQATTPRAISAGTGRLLERSAWWMVTIDGEEAWANRKFLGMLGVTIDMFPTIGEALDSTTAPTIDELIDDIVDTYRIDGDEVELRVERVTDVEGLDANGAQVTIDILGFADDAVQGERLLLTFDVEFEEGSGSQIVAHELVAAQGTAICSRGITDEKLCV